MARHYRHEIESTMRHVRQLREDFSRLSKEANDAHPTGSLVVSVQDMLSLLGSLESERRTADRMAQNAIENYEWAEHAHSQLGKWQAGINRLSA